MLVYLPDGHPAELFQRALANVMRPLPSQLRGSLTWDQSYEMAGHAAFMRDAGMLVYFCDPGSPWQRGANENANGLLRQCFPKHAGLSRYSREDLHEVAAELNSRPCKTLGWDAPAARFAALLMADQECRKT
ncbi:IS30 family transposase [Streptomyces sp. NBC_01077]|nr:IS30 family transposase [Streptomyces sp. NBC_01077]WSV44328.1 IS30 family transposase [Streptomyces sp. NBC_01077]